MRCSESRTDEADGRKRRLTMIFSIVVITLLVVAVVMVAIGLKFSSYIDEVCKSILSVSLFLYLLLLLFRRKSCSTLNHKIPRSIFAFLRALDGTIRPILFHDPSITFRWSTRLDTNMRHETEQWNNVSIYYCRLFFLSLSSSERLKCRLDT